MPRKKLVINPEDMKRPDLDLWVPTLGLPEEEDPWVTNYKRNRPSPLKWRAAPWWPLYIGLVWVLGRERIEELDRSYRPGTASSDQSGHALFRDKLPDIASLLPDWRTMEPANVAWHLLKYEIAAGTVKARALLKGYAIGHVFNIPRGQAMDLELVDPTLDVRSEIMLRPKEPVPRFKGWGYVALCSRDMMDVFPPREALPGAKSYSIRQAIKTIWPSGIPLGLSAKDRNRAIEAWLKASGLSVPQALDRAVQRELKRLTDTTT